MEKYPKMSSFKGWNIEALVMMKRFLDRGEKATEDALHYLTVVKDLYQEFRACVWMYLHIPTGSNHLQARLSQLRKIYSMISTIGPEDIDKIQKVRAIIVDFNTQVYKLPAVLKAASAEKQKGDAAIVHSTDEAIKEIIPEFQPMDMITGDVIAEGPLSVGTIELIALVNDDEVPVPRGSVSDADSSMTVIESSKSSQEDVNMADKTSPLKSSRKNKQPLQKPSPYSRPSNQGDKTGKGQQQPTVPTVTNVPQNLELNTDPGSKPDLDLLDDVVIEDEESIRAQEALKAAQDKLASDLQDREKIEEEYARMRAELERNKMANQNLLPSSSETKDQSTPVQVGAKRVKSDGIGRTPGQQTTRIERVEESPSRKQPKILKRKDNMEFEEMSEHELETLFDPKLIFDQSTNISKTMVESFRGVNDKLYEQLVRASNNPSSGSMNAGASTSGGSNPLPTTSGVTSGISSNVQSVGSNPPAPQNYGEDGVDNDTRLNKLDGAVTYQNWLSGSLNTRLALFSNFFTRFLRTDASVDFSRPVYHNFQTAIAVQFLNTGKIKIMSPDLVTDSNLRDTLTCVEIFMPKVPINLYWRERAARRHCFRYLNAIMESNVNVLPSQFYVFLDAIVSTVQSPTPRIEALRTRLTAAGITSRAQLVEYGSAYVPESLPEPTTNNAEERRRILAARQQYDAIVDTKFQILMEFIEHALETFRNEFVKIWTTLISKSFLMICRRGAVTQHQANRFTTALNTINPNGYSANDYSPEIISTMYNDVKNYIDEHFALVFFNRISSYLGQRYSPVISNYASYTRMSGMSALVIVNTAIRNFADFPWYLARSYFRAAFGAYEKTSRALWNRPYAGYNPSGIEPRFAAKHYADITYLCIELQKRFGGSTGATLAHYKGINRRMISDSVKAQVVELLNLYADRVLVKHSIGAVSVEERRLEFLDSERLNYIFAAANLELIDSLTNNEGVIATPEQLNAISENCQLTSTREATMVYRNDLKQIRPALSSNSPLEELLRQILPQNRRREDDDDAPQGYY